MAREGPAQTEEEGLELIGDPEQLARELEAFSRAARRFHTRQDWFRERYAGQWVAVYEEKLLAAETSDGLFAEMDRNGIPRDAAYVRFVTTEQHAFIL